MRLGTLNATQGTVAFVDMSNVLSEAKKQQVIALGRLGWPLRRIKYRLITYPLKWVLSGVGSPLANPARTRRCRISFARIWALEIMQQRPQLISPEDALKIAEESIPTLGVRRSALLARKYGTIDWVRAQKETWTNHGDWDRRAIIWSASVLRGKTENGRRLKPLPR